MDDSRYKINESTFALIIDSVNVNDSNMNYQCEVSVTNPLTDESEILHTSLRVLLIVPTPDQPEGLLIIVHVHVGKIICSPKTGTRV